jgi:RHS repeat-associated protein
MPHLSAMEWDFAERLSHITRGTTEAYYNYDSNGERVRKVVEKGEGIVETRLYLGGFEIFRKTNANGLLLERETLHIMNDYGQTNTEETNAEEDSLNNNDIPKPKKETPNTWRIAIVDTKTWENNNPVQNIIPVQRYQLSNNIESATLEVDENADIISYEEYYPYGDTSFRGKSSVSEVSEKRYRYAGKEKDDESGLYYFHARYYGSMVGIFISVDPKFEKYPDVSPYAYCLNNPINCFDPTGKQTLDSDNQEPCGRLGETYGIMDGDTFIGGEICTSLYVESKYDITEIKYNDVDDITQVKGKATFNIRLDRNEIFYLKAGYPHPDPTQGLITKDLERSIYLHEQGHKKDNEKIVPPSGIKIIEKIDLKFQGKISLEKIQENVESWLEINRKSKESKYYEILDKAGDLYDKTYKNLGSPWRKKQP